MEERFERYHPDMEAMHHGFRTQPCFVCKLVGGDDGPPKYISYEYEQAVAFLDGYPRAYGYTLVAPKEHREQVTGDFTMQEYIDLQRLVYRVTEAVREEVGAEFDDLSFERVFSSNVYGLLLGVEGTSPLDAPLEGDDQIRQTHLR